MGEILLEDIKPSTSFANQPEDSLGASISIPISENEDFHRTCSPSPTFECSGKTWIQKSDDGSHHFLCLWENCEAICQTFDVLSMHLNLHLDLLREELQSVEPGMKFTALMISLAPVSDFICPIDSCGTPLSYAALRLHISAHKYHINILLKGVSLIDSMRENGAERMRCDRPQSQFLDPHSISEFIACEWDNCTVRSHYIYMYYSLIRQLCFDDYQEFISHLHVHVDLLDRNDRSGPDSFKCKWSGCGKKLKGTKNSLRKHMALHSREKSIACPFCQCSLVSPSVLLSHFKRRIPIKGENSVACEHCHKQFSDEDILMKHVVLHLNRFKCSFCGLLAPDKASLDKHIQARHNLGRERNFICDICTETFYEMRHLKTHKLCHEPKKFQCPQCDQQFRYSWDVKKHVQKVHEDDKTKTKRYLCHLCEKSYVKGNILTKHLINAHNCPVSDSFGRYTYKRGTDGFFRLHSRKIVQLQAVGIS